MKGLVSHERIVDLIGIFALRYVDEGHAFDEYIARALGEALAEWNQMDIVFDPNVIAKNFPAPGATIVEIKKGGPPPSSYPFCPNCGSDFPAASCQSTVETSNPFARGPGD